MSLQRHKVASSDIAEIAYANASQTLEIVFHATGPYRYFSVPRAVFDELLASPTQGKFFHQNIKGKFAWEKVKSETGGQR